jgi:hypothetical protein
MKRIPANMKGGRNSSPTLIANHVEPQTKHSEAKTKLGAFELKILSYQFFYARIPNA